MRISDWSSDVCSSDLLRLSASGRLPAESCGDAGKHWHVSSQNFEMLCIKNSGSLSRGAQTLLIGPRLDIRTELAIMERVDRKSVGEGKSVSVRVDPGGRRIIYYNNVIHLRKKCKHSTLNTA